MSILALALGVWLCQTLPVLPARGRLVTACALAAAAGAAALWAIPRQWTHGRRAGILFLAFATGFLWAAWRAEWRLADALASEQEQRDVVVIGEVAELPDALERGVRFIFVVDPSDAAVPARIQLSWYRARDEGADVPAVRPGERWRLTVRLKRPHGFANPDGFDYEAWLLERNIRATGYVRAGGDNVRLAPAVLGPMARVHRLREAVRTRFAASLPDADYAGVLIALAVGDQRSIPRGQWVVFRNTAVAHLVSISGLHVSMVALMVGALAGWGWRRVPWLVLRFPARKAAALAGTSAAVAYALLAGLGIPAQRALIMLAVVAAALLLGREMRGSRVMAVALLCVLLVDPWAVLSAGFWLSFSAVGVILYLLGGRRAPAPRWRSAVTVQLGITLASVPALLVLFNAFSLVGPLANAVAIPLVSFVVTPLTLLAIVLPLPALLEAAHWLTALLMRWLEWLAAFPFALWQQAAAPLPLVLAAVVGVVWLLLPRGTPARHAGLVAMLPMLWWTPPRPDPGQFRMTALDVGHGMAVHVQTATHDLLYDTGPTYGPGADAGSRVLLPYLAAAGVGRVDRLLISHDDIDHTGGAAALLEAGIVAELMSGLPDGHRLTGTGLARLRSCRAGRRWEWDGVAFEILHPGAEDGPFRRDNDGSCVLRVAAPGGSVLLAGDVEQAAERQLLARAAATLASGIVLVPHHGSGSSSTPEFVRAVGASDAIFSVGYLNPFRHPHATVTDRWEAAGARIWRTDRQGAIRVEVGEAGDRVTAQRLVEPHYWYGR